MKVILLENINKLGKKGEIVNVSDGYGKNYLIKNKKAELATDGAIKKIGFITKKEAEKQKQTKKEIEETISEIEGKEFIIKMKVGDKKQLFEAVTAQKISKKLTKEGYNISESQILIDKPIKELTTAEIKIKFDFDLTANIKIKIEEDK